MRYFPKIRGERLYLSPLHMGDVETYTRWLNDSSVTDGLGFTRQVVTLESERDALTRLMEEDHNFAIVQAEDDLLLGSIGFHDIHPISRSAMCGLFIGEEENRNMGYGTEALILLLRYGFETLNLHNVMLKVFSFNQRAIAAYKKVGFHQVGRRREAYFLHGQYHDDVFMDVLEAEFFEKHGRGSHISL